MRKAKDYRIFLGVQEIAGMMERLNNAFHEMGIESEFYCMSSYAFASDEDRQNVPDKLKKYKKHTYQLKNSQSKICRKVSYYFQIWDIIWFFIYSLFHYKEYIYIYGHGMFFYNHFLSKYMELEFFLLKLFRKKIVMWLCGTDSRATYCGVDVFDGDIQKIMEDTEKKERKIKMLEKYAILIDNPASSHFHSKPYVIVNKIEIPIDGNEKVLFNKADSDKTVILHAPSRMKAKGTYMVRKIINELVEEGYNIEYIEVSGMTHNVVLEKIAQSDIVIDQCFSDRPMSGFAEEAAYNGVPVIVGGYFAEFYKEELPDPIPPTIFCMPDEIKDKLIHLIEHPDERKRIGEAEKEYVENNCLSGIVARKFCMILDNEIPESWLFNPDDNIYAYGCGSHKDIVISNVGRLIDNYGDEALCINKKSKLFAQYQEIYKQYKNMAKNKTE